MNVWQYSRWVYLIGRSIKYKSLEQSERVAFTSFIDEMLKTRPQLKQVINIKKGSNTDWKTQNDYSLGKMIQSIGRNLKSVLLTKEEKVLCDRLFFSTDKRRFLTYNEYQALDGKNVFISPDENLAEAVENCTPYSTIILSNGKWETDLKIVVDGTKITSEGNAEIIGELSINANDVTIENVTIKSKSPVPISINSKDILTKIVFNNANIGNEIVVESKIKDFELKETIVSGGISFKDSSEKISILGSTISGDIVFDGTSNGINISENNINSENGIVLNGLSEDNIVIEGNKFNLE